MYKCFLQFTAVVISMKFKLEEPRHALPPSAKPCSVETLVLLGLTPKKWMDLTGVPTPRASTRSAPTSSAVGAQDS